MRRGDHPEGAADLGPGGKAGHQAASDSCAELSFSWSEIASSLHSSQ